VSSIEDTQHRCHFEGGIDMKRVLTMALLLAVCPTGSADDAATKKEPSAASLLTDGVARAKQDNKRVFLLFGSPN
jgi:hypothetical protein